MEEHYARENHRTTLSKAVKNSGGIALKLVSPGFDGMPDRLVLLPGGKIGFVEVKVPGKEPRPLQVSIRRPSRWYRR